MKKEINKIVIFIGFIVYAIGLIASAFIGDVQFASLTTSSIMVILGVFFIFAKNEVIKNIGYGLCVVCGATGLFSLINVHNGTGAMICFVGEVIILVGVVIKFISIAVKMLGFEKNKDTSQADFIQSLNSLNMLKEEKIITEEEFEMLKREALKKTDNKNLSIADLKQWKKLYDQKIITEEEFSSVKKDLFKN